MRKITNKEFVDSLSKEVTDRYELLSEYLGSNKKILVKCKNCGYERKIYATHLKNNCTCPKCHIKSLSKEKFLGELKKVHGDKYSLIGKYKGTSIYTSFKCNKCGRIWKTMPILMLYGHGCPNKCDKRKVDLINIQKRFDSLYSDKWEYDLSEYTNNMTRIKIKCKKCGTEYDLEAKSLLQYPRICLTCNPTGSSLEENIYQEIIKYYNEKIERNKLFRDIKMPINRKELDIYIPNKKIGIEIDGLYFHSEEYKGRNFQINKKNFFKELYNIRTIFIRSDEIYNKLDIVISRIKSVLGVGLRNIPARKLIVREVPNDLKNKFLNKYHLQGADVSSIRIGLWTKTGKLVSVMTFSKSRSITSAKSDENVYELVRFASRTNINVQGGFSKLLKHSIPILQELGCKRIKTFADRRWTDDNKNVYFKNGFILDHISEPNYVYFKNDYEVYSRVKFQKHKLEKELKIFDPKLSEYQNMLNNGYNRYFDCGNLVYYMNI